MALLFAVRKDNVAGNSSGPSGHLPYEVEAFFSAWASDGKQGI